MSDMHIQTSFFTMRFFGMLLSSMESGATAA